MAEDSSAVSERKSLQRKETMLGAWVSAPPELIFEKKSFTVYGFHNHAPIDLNLSSNIYCSKTTGQQLIVQPLSYGYQDTRHLTAGALSWHTVMTCQASQVCSSLINFHHCHRHSYQSCLLEAPASSYLRLISLPLIFQL